MQPGRYEGKILDYGIGETKMGNPQIFVKFKIGEKSLTWFGSLSEKAIEITGKALIACGFKGTDLSVLADGLNSNALDLDKTLSLVVENEEYKGKTYTKIKWVNELNSGATEKLNKAGAVQKLSGMNLTGKMIQLQQEMGNNVTFDRNQQAQPSPGENDTPPF